MELIVFFALLVVLASLALRWGVDSRLVDLSQEDAPGELEIG